MIKENVLPLRCSVCNLSNKWMGKDLSLVLDHINGVNDDDRLENLRFLCPNCNSQTETFAGRNVSMKKESKFCTCGKEICKTSEQCSVCSRKSRRKVERPPRDVLLKEIEKSNYCKVAEKYGVSDNAIRKWLSNMD